MVRSAAIAKSLPRLQRGPRMNHVCHHCKLQGHTRPNCHKLRALRNASDQRSREPKNDKRTWVVESSRDRNSDARMMDVMKMIGAFTNYLESFTRRFESPNSRTQSYRDITPNARDGEEWYSCIIITTCPCVNTSYVVWLCLVMCLLVV